ncbi:MAG: protein kinase domain-containing protein [Gemmatimonadota bacterium]
MRDGDAGGWHEADRVFRQALDRPPETWDAFLDRMCEGDNALRTRVRSLLEASRESEAYFASAGELLGRVWSGVEGDRNAGALEGRRLGPYLLERRIARGGMGSVYVARRDDGRYEQKAAVKLLRRGLDTEDLVRRFEAERRILAGLDHPHIARLLDAGETPTGRPYLVMELVEGERITAYCDARRLPVDARLDLFVAVGRAVGHAHRHLVVHRDLKPGNILVTAAGEPKLLDFGIAKLLDAEGEPEAATRTRTGLRLLTPRCASPEQVNGKPVTTASDVYQLGLLLYELTCGAVPFDGLDGRELDRAIVEVDPPALSKAVTAAAAADRATERARLTRELSGDLERIVSKALRKEPEKRYPSVEQLVREVERYRAGLPVLATPAGWSYRAGKFVRRNRWAVSAATVLLAFIAAYAVTVTIQSRRLAAERDRATTEATKARSTTDFLIALFEVSDPNRSDGDPVTARALLDASLERLEVELEDEPVVRATLLGTIGRVYTALGEYARALPVLRQSVALLRANPGADPAQLANSLRWLAVLERRVQPDRAAAMLEEALAAAEAAYGRAHPRVADVLIDIVETEPGPRGGEAGERALRILRDAPGDERHALARALQASRFAVPRPAGEARLREAIEIARSVHGDNHTLVAALLNDLALWVEPDDPLEADSLLRRAVEINERIHGPDHAQTLTIMNNLAAVRRDRGDYAAAAPLYREVLARRARAYPIRDNPSERLARMGPRHGLATALTEIGEAVEAESLLRDVVHVADSVYAGGRDHWEFYPYAARSTLGRNLSVQGRFAEAEPLLVESWSWLRENGDPVTRRIALERLVRLYEVWGKPGVADEYRLQRTAPLDGAPRDSAATSAPSAPP